MLKEAIEKIVSLAKPGMYEINGDTYATEDLVRIAPYTERPEKTSFTSLDGVVKAIKAEINRAEIAKPVFVNVAAHDSVVVFTTFRSDNLERDYLYIAKPMLPERFNRWSSHDDAIIMLRSQFIQSEDIAYLLDLLSRISNEDTVTSDDNGLTQKVSATTGIAIRAYAEIRPRVTLAPFRTFLEVGQPESEFILRLKAGNRESGAQPQIGLIEADGGAWKLAAKSNIANYFRAHLDDLIESGAVIVTE